MKETDWLGRTKRNGVNCLVIQPLSVTLVNCLQELFQAPKRPYSPANLVGMEGDSKRVKKEEEEAEEGQQEDSSVEGHGQESPLGFTVVRDNNGAEVVVLDD